MLLRKYLGLYCCANAMKSIQPLHFLGIGAQKAGTTWIYRKLAQHPKISFPCQKEVHFWDQFRARGIEWYRRQFETVDGRLHGEFTPAYAILPTEIIREIRGNFPDIRLIFCIRNPVDRAWSAAKMAIQRSEMRVEEASDQWFLDHFRSEGSLARGDYEKCLRNWLSIYPRESLLLLRFEELVGEPLMTLGKCCRHLGVENLFPTMQICLTDRVRAGSPEPLRPSLKGMLHDIYDRKTHSLSTYLGEDLGAWLE
jgi:hypothetical protein